MKYLFWKLNTHHKICVADFSSHKILKTKSTVYIVLKVWLQLWIKWLPGCGTRANRRFTNSCVCLHFPFHLGQLRGKWRHQSLHLHTAVQCSAVQCTGAWHQLMYWVCPAVFHFSKYEYFLQKQLHTVSQGVLQFSLCYQLYCSAWFTTSRNAVHDELQLILQWRLYYKRSCSVSCISSCTAVNVVPQTILQCMLYFKLQSALQLTVLQVVL